MGVCGKKADTAEIQDKLTGNLIGLVRATEGNEHMVSDSTAAVIVEGLFATLTNKNAPVPENRGINCYIV